MVVSDYSEVGITGVVVGECLLIKRAARRWEVTSGGRVFGTLDHSGSQWTATPVGEPGIFTPGSMTECLRFLACVGLADSLREMGRNL